MTEKGVASSESVSPVAFLSSCCALTCLTSRSATNIQTSIRKEGNDIIVNGHKWWISGAGDPRNAVHLVMGKR